MLVIFHYAKQADLSRLIDLFALSKREKQAFDFSLKKWRFFNNKFTKDSPDWTFMLDREPVEAVLFTAWAVSRDASRGFRNKKKILDYMLALKLKKPFHSNRELIRMGFPEKEIGSLYKRLIGERRSGHITMREQEYNFLVRELKKLYTG